jgi:hypothetical protein
VVRLGGTIRVNSLRVRNQFSLDVHNTAVVSFSD